MLKRLYQNKIIVVFIIALVVVVIFFNKEKNNNSVIPVLSEINVSYSINKNKTRLYKKYYKELEKELANSTIDEDNYVRLVSKLFAIDFYTLTNKVTNKDIGGVDFIHEELKKAFISESSNTIYKYLKKNFNNKRIQQLPEVNDVYIKRVDKIKYSNNNLKDSNSYQVILGISYVYDLDYPKEVILTLIHEDNKLVIVEIR